MENINTFDLSTYTNTKSALGARQRHFAPLIVTTQINQLNQSEE